MELLECIIHNLQPEKFRLSNLIAIYEPTKIQIFGNTFMTGISEFGILSIDNYV